MYWIILQRIRTLRSMRRSTVASGQPASIRVDDDNNYEIGGGRTMHSSYGWKRVEWLCPAAGALMIAVGVSAAVPSTARAQAGVASEANAPNEEAGLGEIVVTARK